MQKGQVIAGEFLLQLLLSRDGTGEVWRALELNVGRLVRLHFLPESLKTDIDFRERLRARAEIQRKIKHPHAVPIERIVESAESDGLFFVSRHVEGDRLDDYADQWIRVEGRFPFNLIFDVFRPVAVALDDMRKMEISHGTLSPQCIIVSQTEGVQIQDFELPGMIRRRLELLDRKNRLVDPGRLRFSAPEQLIGRIDENSSAWKRNRQSDYDADQYALAMLIAELIAKRPLFAASSPEELEKVILTTIPPKLPNISDHANASLQHALHKDPVQRFSSCVQFLDGLAGLISVTYPPAPRPIDIEALTAAPVMPLREDSSNDPLISALNDASDRSSTSMPMREDTATSLSEESKKSVIPAESLPNLLSSQPASQPESGLSDSPSEPLKEPIVSFEKISSDAQQSSAKKIAGKIKRERRIRQMFYLWNILVLIACLVAVYLFRGHLSQVWSQRISDPSSSRALPENEKTGHVEKVSSKETKVVPVRIRRQRKEKAIDFSETNDSAFSIKGLDDGNEIQDEVRFMGIAQTGKKILFVFDASAAMGQGKMTPWTFAGHELVHSFRDFNGSQSFQVVYFSDASRTLETADTAEIWLNPTEANKKSAYEFLKSYQPEGRADPVKALQKAISLNPDVIFFLTDQKSVALSFADVAQLTSSAGNISINCVEIGEGQELNRQSPYQILSKMTQGEYRWVNANFHGLNR